MAQITLENPFQQLITDCDGDSGLLQDRYEAHRSARNAQYAAKILSPNFSGWQVDGILKKLHENSNNRESQFVDTRNNLAIWARPPRHIQELIAEIQEEIRNVAPGLWFTPPDCLHMTTLEITNSQTSSEINTLVSCLEERDVVPEIIDHTLMHCIRLIRPMVNYDTSALALSFIPAPTPSNSQTHSAADGAYTYHHLRRDVCEQVMSAGIKMNTRYTAPSAHITIARFITQKGFQLEEANPDKPRVDKNRVRRLIETIEVINHKLQHEYWSNENRAMISKGEWCVGQEKGLEIHGGRSWYGGGEAFHVGKGFD
ncbi:hypothetical protein PHISCL_01401 [Aspergillus sclerotialis]|uniref:RNA ligase/cyclic nucleotide phosphodiesterase n=1 Tax=Aspergillus sclerotialis TaxID=2070753 RepID=A0A3A2ZV85_9EURO|nr:hypothetical protein PHISCL_01401 [Aspergillus sclerotialis]